MTTEAQMRRNRQNAKHSTGPRSIEGKNRSRFNAVKHGCTAKLVLLPEEKPAEFNRRTKGIFEHFLPQTQYEVDVAEGAVYCSWQLKRCREAGWVRLHAKAVTGHADEQQRLENEVSELSAELFRAPNGRPTVLPRGEMPDASEKGNACKGKLDAGGEKRPAVVVRRLESNPLGINWLIIEWNALLAPFERGEGWNASERFRVMRLLGLHPMDAYLNDDLTSMLYSCQTLDPTAGSLVGDVWNEVVSANDLPVIENQYQRRVEQRPAMDRERALEYLIGVVRTEIVRLEEKAQEHQVRAELMAELAPNLAGFDLSHEGLLMLRYEFAWQRLMDRKTNELKKLSEERAKSGRGRSNSYLLPSEGWLQAECDEHDHPDDDHVHEQDDCAGLNDDRSTPASVDAQEQPAAIVARGDEAVELGFRAVLRNEPKGVSRAIEGTTEDVRGSVRNEPSAVFATDSHGKLDDTAPEVLRNDPKDASGVIEGTTDGEGDSLRNEPKVISEAIAVGREDGDVEVKVVRKEGLVVRSVRFDEGLSGAMRHGANLLRPGIGLRDAVRSGNREGGGGSRRERRLRKKEEARAQAR